MPIIGWLGLLSLSCPSDYVIWLLEKVCHLKKQKPSTPLRFLYYRQIMSRKLLSKDLRMANPISLLAMILLFIKQTIEDLASNFFLNI